MSRIPKRQNVATPAGITVNEFKKIIKTKLGEHFCDQFLRLDNLPVPYLGRTQTGDKNGDVNFPDPWLPHGTQESQDRWMASGRGLLHEQAYTSYIGDKEKPIIKRDQERTLFDFFESDEYVELIRQKQQAKTKTAKKRIQSAINKIEKQLKKDQEERYLSTTKVERTIEKRRKKLFAGVTEAEEQSLFYSTLSALFLTTPSGKNRTLKPRPLLGSSEKTMKNDGTTAEVRVMYLSPASRSNNPYWDEWMVFEAYPQDMDRLAKEKGMYPSRIDMSDFPNLEQQYKAVRKQYKKAGYEFRLNPLVKNTPMYPSSMKSNPNTCPHAGACSALCLVDSGQMGTAIGAQRSGYYKTWYFYLYPLLFLRQIVLECFKESKRSKKFGMVFYARLNGTSDIAWERFIDMDKLVEYANQNGGDFGGFYDYTKYPIDTYQSGKTEKLGRRDAGLWGPNGCPMSYDLTFSLSEQILTAMGCSIDVNAQSQALQLALAWIRNGFRCAVVVDQWKYHPFWEWSPTDKQGRISASRTPKRWFATKAERERIEAWNAKNAGTMNDAKMATWYDRIPVVDKDGKQKEDADGQPMYETDANGFYIYEPTTELYAVTDFTDLAKTAINSRDDEFRGQNILIVDADETDFRFNDPKPSICILKPKGIFVASPEKAKEMTSRTDGNDLFRAGDLYLFSRTRKTGLRVPKTLKGATKQFVFSAKNILEIQDIFLKELNQSSGAVIDDCLIDVATAVNMKGGVEKSNLLKSVKTLKNVKGRINANVQIFDIIGNTKSNPSRLIAKKHPTYGVWVLIYRDGFVDIDGVDNWGSKAQLKRDLKRAGLGLNAKNQVTGKHNL